MLSELIKFVITAISFSPFILIYWIVIVIQRIQGYKLPEDSSPIDILTGVLKSIILPDVWLLAVFILIIILFSLLINWIKHHLTIRPIHIVNLESLDGDNISLMVLSYFLPALNFFPTINQNKLYSLVMAIFLLVIILVNKNSNNYNPVLLGLKYRHYKCTTADGLSLFVLSKSKIINTSQVEYYIQLTDYLILDIS